MSQSNLFILPFYIFVSSNKTTNFTFKQIENLCLCCIYSNDDNKKGIKPVMLRILRELAIPMAAGEFTEEEADDDSKEYFNFFFIIRFDLMTLVILHSEHWLMNVIRERLTLKSSRGMTKAKKETAFRRYRKEIFNRNKAWYPVLKRGLFIMKFSV
jgi:hypothetical protein